jgi:hypothetical protein
MGETDTIRYDANGLITAVAQDAGTGDVLMVAHMNREALRQTLTTGQAWYWSRSRGRLWRKGEESGHTQRVVDAGRLRRRCPVAPRRADRTGVPYRPAILLFPHGGRGERRTGHCTRARGSGSAQRIVCEG